MVRSSAREALGARPESEEGDRVRKEHPQGHGRGKKRGSPFGDGRAAKTQAVACDGECRARVVPSLRRGC